MLIKKLLVAVLILSSAVAAKAGVIYDESVTGDLSVLSPVTLSLQDGINTLRGSSGEVDYPTSAYGDYDSFLFTLGAGQVLNSVTFRILGYELASPQTIGLQTNFTLSADSYFGTPVLAKWFNVLSAAPQPQVFLNNRELIAPGLYSFGTTGFSISSQPDAAISGGLWNYEIIFDVPEPGALSLAVVGLLAVGMMRWNKRSNSH